jgi:hypothetical protein
VFACFEEGRNTEAWNNNQWNPVVSISGLLIEAVVLRGELPCPMFNKF